MASSSLKHLCERSSLNTRRRWRCVLGARPRRLLSSLRLETTPEPLTEPDQVRVEVRAIGLFADIFSVLDCARPRTRSSRASASARSARGSSSPASSPSADRPRAPACKWASASSALRGSRRVPLRGRCSRAARAQDSVESFEEGAASRAGADAWHGLVELGGAARGGTRCPRGGWRRRLHAADLRWSLPRFDRGCSGGDGEKAALVRAPPACARRRARAHVRHASVCRAAERGARRRGRVWRVMDSLGGRWFDCALQALAPMGRLCTSARRAVTAARRQARKWLSLIPAYLARPRVDPEALTSTNRGVLGFNLIFLTEREDLLAAEAVATPHALACALPREIDTCSPLARRDVHQRWPIGARPCHRAYVFVRRAPSSARIPPKRRERW